MNGELPNGWIKARIGDVAEINPRHPRALADSLNVSFVPMAALDEFRPALKYLEERPLGEVRRGFTHFADGDVLFAKITPCMENGKGAVAKSLRNGIGCGTTELIVVRSNGAVDPEYLYQFLAQPSVRAEAKEHFTGTAGQARVPKEFIEELEMPIAPISEQRRIVAALANLHRTTDSCRRHIARARALLAQFRQIVLAAACSGQLTKTWRVVQRRPSLQGWRDATLADICSVITDGDHQPPPKQASGIPFVTIGNLSSGHLDFSDTRFVSREYFSQIKAERKPTDGDVLYTVVATIGIPVRVDTNREFCFQRHIALLRPAAVTTPDFLMILLGSPRTLREANVRATGTAQPTLSLSNLRTIAIKLPPLDEQKEIGRLVAKLMSAADSIERRLSDVSTAVEHLQRSIDRMAFRGELTLT